MGHKHCRFAADSLGGCLEGLKAEVGNSRGGHGLEYRQQRI